MTDILFENFLIIKPMGVRCSNLVILREDFKKPVIHLPMYN